MTPYHRAPAGAWRVWSMSDAISDAKRWRLKASAWARATIGSNGRAAQLAERLGERLGSRLAHENAGHPIEHGLARAALGEGHDRPAARLRFHGHDAEILLTRQQDSLGAPVGPVPISSG